MEKGMWYNTNVESDITESGITESGITESGITHNVHPSSWYIWYTTPNVRPEGNIMVHYDELALFSSYKFRAKIAMEVRGTSPL